ncbi:hypothetical protein [Pseudoduganella sp. RAF53_2]|uniref:hypothetical protein n=1 Tax=unclassified Pseudoduganella TaxID=2637179 RepID=UPI003F95F529
MSATINEHEYLIEQTADFVRILQDARYALSMQNAYACAADDAAEFTRFLSDNTIIATDKPVTETKLCK